MRVVHALCAAVMFFLAWQVWIKAGTIAAYGDTTDVLRITVGAVRLLHGGDDRAHRRWCTCQDVHPGAAARAAGHDLNEVHLR